MKTLEDIKPFAAKLETDLIAGLVARECDCEANRLNARTSVKMGVKFAKVDTGSSGMYMVDLATGDIYGIKAYGVVHRGHRFGTLDTIHEWDWSDYRAHRIVQQPV